MTVTEVLAPPREAVARFRKVHPLLVQISRYMIVGGFGTSVNAGTYLVLRTWWEIVPANLTALLVSTLVSTEVNRRFTFGGALTQHWRAHVQNAGTIAFYAGYSSAVLLLLTALVDDPTPLLETVTVAAASVLGGAGRFLLLRHWVFRGADDADSRPVACTPLLAPWHSRTHQVLVLGPSGSG